MCDPVRKRVFLSHLHIKMLILPRQARDKHKENSKKDAFLQGCRAITRCRFTGSVDASCTCERGTKTAGNYCSDSSCLVECNKWKPFYYCK